MEVSNGAIVTVNTTNNHNVAAPATKQLKGKNSKKKVNVLKAALLTLFGRSRKTTKRIQENVVTDPNNWAKLVGCMRPVNITQDKESTLMLPDTKNIIIEDEVLEKKDEEIVLVNKNEEDDYKLGASSSCSSECGGDSRFASALNLQELDKSGSSEDDDENEIFDDTQGDAMIDMKAEMFIAQFYAQMRIQNSNNTATIFESSS